MQGIALHSQVPGVLMQFDRVSRSVRLTSAATGARVMTADLARRWPRVRVAALLNGSQYRPANGLGKLNGRKKSLRVEVVLARFVDDPNLPVFCRISVRENPIDLSPFQGNFVAFIFEADDELFRG